MKLKRTTKGNYFGYHKGYYIFIYRRPHGKWCCRIGKGGEIYKAFTSREQIEEWHKGKGTMMGECTCSKCGVPYTAINNPHYL